LAGAAASLLEGVITPADGDGDASNIAKSREPLLMKGAKVCGTSDYMPSFASFA
jgi:hypothetical protein